MNIKKVEKQAKKITQMLENIKDEGHVSRIEKDLLLSYIRDLYEKVLNVEEDNKHHSNKSAPVVERSKYENPTPPAPPKPVEIAEVVRQEISENISIPEPTIQREPIVIAEPKVESAPPVVQVPEPIVDDSPSAPTELLELFNAAVTTELSDRLSRSPINDLTKSMGINEKIFTVKELFGGDSALFSNTMSELDKLNSLEQARDYLVKNVAVQEDWANDVKIKKAATFIKLISRRY